MKKLFSTMAVAAALFAGYSAYNSTEDSELVNIALMNVEALAQAEGVTSGPYVAFHFADDFGLEIRIVNIIGSLNMMIVELMVKAVTRFIALKVMEIVGMVQTV